MADAFLSRRGVSFGPTRTGPRCGLLAAPTAWRCRWWEWPVRSRLSFSCARVQGYGGGSYPPSSRGGGPPQGRAVRTLFVSNLLYETQEDELMSAFST